MVPGEATVGAEAAADGATKANKRRKAKATLEEERDLREFLKVIRPEWSMCRESGVVDIDRVMIKLNKIGVKDAADLLRRVNEGTINIDLTNAGYSHFGE